VHATSTTADAVRADGSSLVARAATPGTHTTTLSDGRSVATTIASVPAAQNLTHWALDVDDFLPGATPTQTPHATHTTSTTADVISTAGDTALTVGDPGHLTNGAFALPSPLEVAFSTLTFTLSTTTP
jgi:hypothetical protein